LAGATVSLVATLQDDLKKAVGLAAGVAASKNVESYVSLRIEDKPEIWIEAMKRVQKKEEGASK
jgi:hypothetical protein